MGRKKQEIQVVSTVTIVRTDDADMLARWIRSYRMMLELLDRLERSEQAAVIEQIQETVPA